VQRAAEVDREPVRRIAPRPAIEGA
jgi:hypothetical protein